MTLARYSRALQDVAGNLLATPVSIEVRREGAGSPLAQLFSDRAGLVPIANPITVSAGQLAFHAIGSAYRIRSLTVGYALDERYVAIGTAGEQDANSYSTAGFQFQSETGSAGPPSDGCIRFDNLGALGSATKAFVSYTTSSGSDIHEVVQALASGAKTVKNKIVLVNQSDGTVVSFDIGTVTDHTTWAELAVSGHSGEASITAGLPFNLQPEFTGPDGLNGVDGTSLLARVRAVATSNVVVASALESGDVIDGVTLATNDFVLLTGQTAPAENGVYTVVASGGASRTTAFNSYDSMPGAFFSVMEGTLGADTLWHCTSNKGGTLGTTALVFANGAPLADGTVTRAKLAADAIKRVRGDNLLPNSNWQLCSAYLPVTGAVSAMKPDGTGLQSAIFINSFTAGSGQPTVLCSDTKEIINGTILTFGSSHGGFSGYGIRVWDLVSNTSFRFQLPFSKVSPSSSTLNAYPVGIGDNGTLTYGPDGWSKTSSLIVWADDFPTNAAPGAKRVLGLRKGSGSAEKIYWAPASKGELASLRGRTISIGALVRQKVGAANDTLYIYDGTTTTSSTAFTGSGFTHAANNNYEFKTVSATIPLTATSVEIGLALGGSSGDIAYLALPTAKFGETMLVEDLGQPRNELVRALTHWNPPCLTPFLFTFPGAEIIGGSGLYGWADLDLEALSYGQVHHSVSKVNHKLELTTATVEFIVFTAALDIPRVALTFGSQVSTQVANKLANTPMAMLPLITGQSGAGSLPGCFSMFSNIASGAPTNITFDFDDVICN